MVINYLQADISAATVLLYIISALAFIIVAGLGAFILYGKYHYFDKIGLNGLYGLVPIYSLYILCKDVAGMNAWWFIPASLGYLFIGFSLPLGLIGFIVTFVANYAISFNLAKRMKKDKNWIILGTLGLEILIAWEGIGDALVYDPTIEVEPNGPFKSPNTNAANIKAVNEVQPIDKKDEEQPPVVALAVNAQAPVAPAAPDPNASIEPTKNVELRDPNETKLQAAIADVKSMFNRIPDPSLDENIKKDDLIYKPKQKDVDLKEEPVIPEAKPDLEHTKEMQAIKEKEEKEMKDQIREEMLQELKNEIKNELKKEALFKKEEEESVPELVEEPIKKETAPVLHTTPLSSVPDEKKEEPKPVEAETKPLEEKPIENNPTPTIVAIPVEEAPNTDIQNVAFPVTNPDLEEKPIEESKEMEFFDTPIESEESKLEDAIATPVEESKTETVIIAAPVEETPTEPEPAPTPELVAVATPVEEPKAETVIIAAPVEETPTEIEPVKESTPELVAVATPIEEPTPKIAPVETSSTEPVQETPELVAVATSVEEKPKEPQVTETTPVAVAVPVEETKEVVATPVEEPTMVETALEPEENKLEAEELNTIVEEPKEIVATPVAEQAPVATSVEETKEAIATPIEEPQLESEEKPLEGEQGSLETTITETQPEVVATPIAEAVPELAPEVISEVKPEPTPEPKPEPVVPVQPEPPKPTTAAQQGISLAGQTPAVKPLRRAVSKPVMPNAAATHARFKND